ncbi:uncharacterized protein LOC129917862 [Episyrphus balteatus]|uniref:uncharacterized protein LOC129917862 n=1 Tax=Episyrphus balteatus TaxID=286459 RepID=UPI00248569F3|nr:uncharacterized protein LOC129917862 [Episyrphus balteatus]
MKKLIVIIFALVIIQTSDADSEFDCIKTENITQQEYSDMVQNKARLPDIENQTNERFKCYTACFLEAMNIMDGCSYQLEAGKRYAVRNNIDRLLVPLDLCKDSSKGNERCNCGYNVFKCLMDNFD